MKNANARIRPLPLITAVVGSAVLIGLACSGDLPINSPQDGSSALDAAPESGKPQLDVNGDPLILLEVDADGVLRMDGEVQEISTLAEALESIATRETVVKVQVHPRTTYGAVSDITDQVRAVGLLRVIFAQEAVEEGYAFVLPPSETPPPPVARGPMEVDGVRVEPAAPATPMTPVPPRNLLNMRVMANGVVRVRRGEDAGDGQLMTTQQMTEVLAREHGANANTIAVLLAGAETPYRFVYEALGAIQASPVKRYSIQVEEGRAEE